ncbi:hypothetical protein HKX69_06495 [Streptomyces argyrophyllae]|uniref:DUF393 domain-containing protein n=2 Tax=Streptomyces argyrophylli TaxID=2726118 RepID=A0A6M4PSX1_9ACTN|nr:hypothetical protein [Streptomyces argyrophyllae]QJS14205.1 hypothetical protein HKX69_06495 [Streptomyces argyrophyllae]
MNPSHRAEGRPRRLPLLVYDGDCGFCTASVRPITRHVSLLTVPIRWLTHGVYRLVAARRHQLPCGTGACRAGGHAHRSAQQPQ